jgi:hypothetical protein
MRCPLHEDRAGSMAFDEQHWPAGTERAAERETIVPVTKRGVDHRAAVFLDRIRRAAAKCSVRALVPLLAVGLARRTFGRCEPDEVLADHVRAQMRKAGQLRQCSRQIRLAARRNAADHNDGRLPRPPSKTFC